MCFLSRFGLGQVLKHGLSLLHGLSLAVPGAFRIFSLATFVVVFWAAGSFVSFGWLLVGFLLVGLLSVYQNAGERYISMVGLCLLAVMPVLWPGFYGRLFLIAH